jgi:hypothetical protein
MTHRTRIRHQILLLTLLATVLMTAACTSSLTDPAPEVLEYCPSAEVDIEAAEAAVKEGNCIPAQTRIVSTETTL